MNHFLKSLLNFLQYCFCSVFWFFRHMWNLSSPTRDQNLILCVGRWSLNYQTTREVSKVGFWMRKKFFKMKEGASFDNQYPQLRWIISGIWWENMELGEVGPSLARAETLVMNVSCNVSGQHIKLELDKKNQWITAPFLFYLVSCI